MRNKLVKKEGKYEEVKIQVDWEPGIEDSFNILEKLSEIINTSSVRSDVIDHLEEKLVKLELYNLTEEEKEFLNSVVKDLKENLYKSKCCVEFTIGSLVFDKDLNSFSTRFFNTCGFELDEQSIQMLSSEVLLFHFSSIDEETPLETPLIIQEYIKEQKSEFKQMIRELRSQEQKDILTSVDGHSFGKVGTCHHLLVMTPSSTEHLTEVQKAAINYLNAFPEEIIVNETKNEIVVIVPKIGEAYATILDAIYVAGLRLNILSFMVNMSDSTDFMMEMFENAVLVSYQNFYEEKRLELVFHFSGVRKLTKEEYPKIVNHISKMVKNSEIKGFESIKSGTQLKEEISIEHTKDECMIHLIKDPRGKKKEDSKDYVDNFNFTVRNFCTGVYIVREKDGYIDLEFTIPKDDLGIFKELAIYRIAPGSFALEFIAGDRKNRVEIYHGLKCLVYKVRGESENEETIADAIFTFEDESCRFNEGDFGDVEDSFLPYLNEDLVENITHRIWFILTMYYGKHPDLKDPEVKKIRMELEKTESAFDLKELENIFDQGNERG